MRRQPPTNMFHLYFDAPADVVLDARDHIAGLSGCWLFDRVRPAEVPGWSLTELYIGDRLLVADDSALMAAYAQLDAALRAR
jgi:hypothetical protein